ncbi:MAG: tyrosine-type recombinase/integrase [Clostridiales bacterium]|nr:tyrosine-type recombinase/integrase [Clostridiales bacterium]
MTYQEQVAAERTEKIRYLLRDFPPSCADFIRSITLTTSPLTRMAYTIDLGVFFNYLFKEVSIFASKTPAEISDEDLDKITTRHLHGYIDYLTLYFKEESSLGDFPDGQRALRNRESGIMRKLSTLRSFFDFLYRAERISGNVATLVALPKLHEKPILYLNPEEVERLLMITQSGDDLSPTQKRYHKFTFSRDYAMLMLFLGTGMRVSECVGLNLEDLDFESLALMVTRKGGNQVVLYFPKEVGEALQAYLMHRMEIIPQTGHENALFLSMQNKRISQRAVQLMVKKYSSLAVPLKKRMSPHKLRSTYATQLYQETEDIYLVADALGHSDVNTTRKHYAAMSDRRRREAAANVHLPSPTRATLPKALSEEEMDSAKASSIQEP